MARNIRDTASIPPAPASRESLTQRRQALPEINQRRLKTCDRPSREAAQKCSPGRKPGVGKRKRREP